MPPTTFYGNQKQPLMYSRTIGQGYCMGMVQYIAATVSSGNACNFCHLEHPDKLAKLDKKQRMLLQKLVRNTWKTSDAVCMCIYINIYIYINICILYSLLFVETSFSGHCDLQHYPLSIIDLYCNHVYLIIIRLWSICMYSPLFKPPIIVYGHSIASCTCPDRRHDIKLS